MVNLQQFPTPTEGIRYQNSAIVAIIENSHLGNGTVYVTESVLSWRSASCEEGFQLEYPRMCLHAISRDINVNPTPCIYIMVNGKFCFDAEEMSEDEKDDEDDPEEETTEIKLVPENPEILLEIYNVIQQCSLLHPDPASDMSEEEEENEDGNGFGGGGDFGYDDEDDYESDNDGHVRGIHAVGDNGDIGQIHPNQFDDAD